MKREQTSDGGARRTGGQLLEFGQQDFRFAVGPAEHVNACAGLRLEVPPFETIGEAKCAERPDEDVRSDDQIDRHDRH